jgi:L-iditol 2-dehydrogenase
VKKRQTNHEDEVSEAVKVARLYTIDDIRIEDDPLPTVGPGEALVRTRACGICTGDLMGWYMKRKAPLVFGHEPAGEVVEVGDGVENIGVGDRVFAHHHAPCGRCRVCRRGDYVHCKTWRSTSLKPGGMAEFFVVPADNLAGDTLKLPDAVDFAAGSLIEPAACVVKSLRRSGVKAGDTMVVIGVGIMGQLHVALGADLGARVIAADRVPFRLERAKELGAAEAVHVDERSLEDSVREATDGAMADVVIVGPGSINAMQSGIAIAGPGSTVVLFTASMPDDELAVSPFRLYFDEISLVPSYSCGPDDTREALALIERGAVPVDKLVTHRFGLGEVQTAMRAAADVDAALKTLIVFD